MANIPLKTIKFPGLSDTYTVPEIDNTLLNPGEAADAKKTGEEISTLKEELKELLDVVFTSEDYAAFNVIQGGITVTGANYGAIMARTQYFDVLPNTAYYLVLDSTNYSMINPCLYGNATQYSFSRNVSNGMLGDRAVLFKTGDSELKFRVAFYLTTDEETAIDSSEYETIRSAIHIYTASLSGLEDISAANERMDLYVPQWIQGRISDNGKAIEGASNRLRTVFIDATNKEFFVNVAEGYQYSIYYYSQRNLQAFVKNTKFSGDTLAVEKGYWIALVAKVNDDSDLIPSTGYNVVDIKEVLHQNWNGLYVSMLGDSISTFAGYIPPENVTYYSGSNYGVTNVKQMWWYKAINIIGGKPLIMDNWSGSCVASDVRTPTQSNSYLAMSDESRCQRLHAYVQGTSSDYDLVVTADNISDIRTSPFLDAYTPQVGDYVKRINPDIILCTGGGNDYSYNCQLGTWDGHSDLDSSITTTFREAYANMLNRIRAEYPFALVVCFVPFFFVRPAFTTLDENQVNRNTIGNTYHDYHAAIKDVAELMACPVIDVFSGGFNRRNYYDTFCTDSPTTPTHPTSTGQQIIGRNAAAQLVAVCNGYIDWLKDN